MTGPHNAQRFDDAKRLASSGVCQKEAAAILGMRPSDLSQYAKRHGLQFRHGLKRDGQDDRSKTMVSLYRSGQTLQDIGDLYGLTRERVRQIITKSAGRLRNGGGAAFKASVNRDRLSWAKDTASLMRRGCTVEQWKYLRDVGREMIVSGAGWHQTPLGAHSSQRGNAANRGIGWELTLWQWWQIWQESGRWSQRGRGRGYVMCRHGDVGPYAIANVYIATAVHNVSERASKTSGLPCGVHRRGVGFVASRVIKGKTIYLGAYRSPEIAHAAYLAQRKLEEFIRPRGSWGAIALSLVALRGMSRGERP